MHLLDLLGAFHIAVHCIEVRWECPQLYILLSNTLTVARRNTVLNYISMNLFPYASCVETCNREDCHPVVLLVRLSVVSTFLQYLRHDLPLTPASASRHVWCIYKI